MTKSLAWAVKPGNARLAVLVTLLAGALALPAAAGAQMGENKAFGRPATASSWQEAREYADSINCIVPTCVPGNAVDRAFGTRWASDRADGQWWQVDLGRPRLVDAIWINWENSYAPRYLIGLSLDGVNFVQGEERTSSPGLKVSRFSPRFARFVRITGLERRVHSSGRRFGISFWDVGVFGPVDPPSPPPVAQTAPAPLPAVPASTASPSAPALMGPFPIVRIRGTLTRTGARISLLTVRAPRGARVEIRCLGGGCPPRAGVYRSPGVVRARRFHRRLRAGAVVEVLVTRRGRIGKYTRFRIRKGRHPVRTDACVAFRSRKSMRCPES